jgi:hypothetical protein
MPAVTVHASRSPLFATAAQIGTGGRSARHFKEARRRDPVGRSGRLGGELGRMSELELDALLLTTLGTLQRHDVQFVLVGDVAEAIYNHGGFVSGVAIVPASYGRNVERLIAALRALDAEMGIAGIPASESVDWWRTDLRDLAPCSFMTSGADVDVDFEPGDTRGYQDLFDDASQIELAPGVAPLVASAEDLERVVRATAPAAPYARPPAALPPDGHWPEEQIRARRASRTTGY